MPSSAQTVQFESVSDDRWGQNVLGRTLRHDGAVAQDHDV